AGGGEDFGLGGKMGHGFEKRSTALVDRSQSHVVSDKGHARVAETVQVLYDFFHAFAVVNSNVGDVLFGGADVVKDHGNTVVVQHLNQIGIHLRYDRRQPCNPPSNHQAGAGNQLLRPVVGVGGHDLISV